MEEKDQNAGLANFMQLTPTGKQLEEKEEEAQRICNSNKLNSNFS